LGAWLDLALGVYVERVEVGHGNARTREIFSDSPVSGRVCLREVFLIVHAA